MKTIQCAHPPNHHNGFVATYIYIYTHTHTHTHTYIQPVRYYVHSVVHSFCTLIRKDLKEVKVY